MKISQIYKKYKIPINLQEHMLRTAGVGQIICENLVGIEVDGKLVVKTLLVHDMGNIVKFDFSRVEMLDIKDRGRVVELKRLQEEFWRKYGRRVEKATLAIIKEEVEDERVVELCEGSHWERAGEFVEGEEWDKKIVCYADMRVGPFGILGLKERFDNLIERNPNRKVALEGLRKEGKRLEGQIQGKVRIDLGKIDDVMVEEIVRRLSFEI